MALMDHKNVSLVDTPSRCSHEIDGQSVASGTFRSRRQQELALCESDLVDPNDVSDSDSEVFPPKNLFARGVQSAQGRHSRALSSTDTERQKASSLEKSGVPAISPPIRKTSPLLVSTTECLDFKPQAYQPPPPTRNRAIATQMHRQISLIDNIPSCETTSTSLPILFKEIAVGKRPVGANKESENNQTIRLPKFAPKPSHACGNRTSPSLILGRNHSHKSYKQATCPLLGLQARAVDQGTAEDLIKASPPKTMGQPPSVDQKASTFLKPVPSTANFKSAFRVGLKHYQDEVDHDRVLKLPLRYATGSVPTQNMCRAFECACCYESKFDEPEGTRLVCDGLDQSHRICSQCVKRYLWSTREIGTDVKFQCDDHGIPTRCRLACFSPEDCDGLVHVSMRRLFNDTEIKHFQQDSVTTIENSREEFISQEAAANSIKKENDSTANNSITETLFHLRKAMKESLSEVRVRSCPQCHRAYVKNDDGCNKIVCPNCRTTMCYCCRKIIVNGYDHFVKRNGVDKTSLNICPLWTNDSIDGIRDESEKRNAVMNLAYQVWEDYLSAASST